MLNSQSNKQIEKAQERERAKERDKGSQRDLISFQILASLSQDKPKPYQIRHLR